MIAGRRGARPSIWLSADGRGWTAVDLPLAEGIEGEAAVARDVGGGRRVVFGDTSQDAGNGGSFRVADLVWTLDRLP